MKKNLPPLNLPEDGPIKVGGLLLLGVLALELLSGCAMTIPGLTLEEQGRLARQEQSGMFAGQPPLTGTLTLHEAMARALKYNLDLRQKQMEETLSQSQLEVSQLELLPRLVASAGYSTRTPDNTSISKSVATGLISKEASVSSDASSRTADLTLTWNLLDFGVGYFQARQDGNKVLVQHEYRRKAAHNLIRDVRLAFWKAASAQALEKEMAAILKASEGAVAEARRVENEELRSPVQSLQLQLGLLEIIRQMEKSLADLSLAKEELAAMLNLPPGTPYRLNDDSGTMEQGLLAIGLPPEELEQMALSSRPELLIERLQGRIEADETRKAMIRLFPGLELDGSRNFDSNTYLVNQHWAQAGARVSWNLLRALTGKPLLDLGEGREEALRMRRLVAHMAVLSQTRIACREYQTARHVLQRLVVENEARERLQSHFSKRSELGLESRLSYIHAAASAVLGRTQQYEAFARYQSALGQLYATLGLDPIEEGAAGADLRHLARHLRVNEGRWQRMIFVPLATLPQVSKDGATGLSAAEPASDQMAKDDVRSAEVGRKEAVAERAAIAATAAPSSAARFIVQVLATTERKEAEALVAELQSKGYRPFLNTVAGGDGRPIVQVWIGRYQTSIEAQAAMADYRRREGGPVFVRRLYGRASVGGMIR
ncbi:MAG: TolC family protein [Magnetococcales bacterium]|nr:TolC family protein [Magnetococcales bacterium]